MALLSTMEFYERIFGRTGNKAISLGKKCAQDTSNPIIGQCRKSRVHIHEYFQQTAVIASGEDH